MWLQLCTAEQQLHVTLAQNVTKYCVSLGVLRYIVIWNKNIRSLEKNYWKVNLFAVYGMTCMRFNENLIR